MADEQQAAAHDQHGAERWRPDSQKSPDELREEIGEAREELGETVEQLAAKANVKARAHERMEEQKEHLRDQATTGMEQAKENPVIPLAVAAGVVVLLLLVRRARSGD